MATDGGKMSGFVAQGVEGVCGSPVTLDPEP